MDHDIRSREIIARAISTACGEYEDVPVGFEYWGMTDDVLAALAAAGLLVISTASLVPLDQDNPRPEAYILNEHVLRLQAELEEVNVKLTAVEAFAERCFDTNDGVTPAYGVEIWQALGREVGEGW